MNDKFATLLTIIATMPLIQVQNSISLKEVCLEPILNLSKCVTPIRLRRKGVGLSAHTPRFAAGYPLQSLTQAAFQVHQQNK